jgi:hypothetical protein
MAAINGYRQLVYAGQSLRGTELLQRIDTLSEAELAGFLEANAAILKYARQALCGECSVPISFDAAFCDEQSRAIVALRDLARAFAVEFSAIERRGIFTRAVAVGVNILALANAARRGGLVVDSLAAVTFEDLGIERLRSLRRRLDAIDSIGLADAVLKHDAARERFNDVVERDIEWDRKVVYPDVASGAREEQSSVKNTAIPGDTNPGVDQLIRATLGMPIEQLRVMERHQDDRRIALCRMLAIEAALIAHRATCGAYPPELGSLAPKFIARIPADPFTGEDFKFRRTGETYCLYSPGPSNQDHGGKFGHWLEVQAGTADLCLDLSDYGMSCDIRFRPQGLMSRIVSRVRRVWARF